MNMNNTLGTMIGYGFYKLVEYFAKLCKREKTKLSRVIACQVPLVLTVCMFAERKRITRESFEKFLALQDKYKLDETNDYEEISMEENIILAEHRRKKLKNKQHRADNGNLDYLTFDEAALLANVSRATIYEWSRKNYFPVVHVVKASRIPRKEFEQYLEKRKLEEGDEKNGINKRKKR